LNAVREWSETPASSSKLSPAVQKGLAWLVAAQHEDGGWGAGALTAERPGKNG